MNATTSTIGIIILTSGLSGCAGMSNTEIGTAVGAVGGAAVGSALTGGSTVGVIGGAAVGGIIGHEVGEDRDRAERRRR